MDIVQKKSFHSNTYAIFLEFICSPQGEHGFIYFRHNMGGIFLRLNSQIPSGEKEGEREREREKGRAEVELREEREKSGEERQKRRENKCYEWRLNRIRNHHNKSN